MSSSTDQGEQVRHIHYGQPFTSKNVNRRFADIIPEGIYQGLIPTVSSNSQVRVSPGVVQIQDDQSNTIRIETTTTVTVEPTPSKPWVVLQWFYNDQEEWYAELKATQSLTNQMIAIAKATFDMNDNIDGLDLRDRGLPYHRAGLQVQKEFISEGGRVEKTTEVDSTTYTVTRQDHGILVRTDSVGGDVTINLPSGTNLRPGRILRVYDAGNASANNIILDSGTNESIGSSDTYTINTDRAFVIVQYFDAISEWAVK